MRAGFVSSWNYFNTPVPLRLAARSQIFSPGGGHRRRVGWQPRSGGRVCGNDSEGSSQDLSSFCLFPSQSRAHPRIRCRSCYRRRSVRWLRARHGLRNRVRCPCMLSISTRPCLAKALSDRSLLNRLPISIRSSCPSEAAVLSLELLPGMRAASRSSASSHSPRRRLRKRLRLDDRWTQRQAAWPRIRWRPNA
jgi:hypothetical protein